MNLFGKKKNQVSTFQPAEAIQKLQTTLTLLEKREQHLEIQVANFKKDAVNALKNKQKSKALYNLKKSKIYEKQMTSIFNTKLNIETQIAAISQASINNDTISAMKIGRDVLVQSEKTIDPEKVADVMDELEEKLVGIDEVAEAMGRSIGPPVDEDELLRELEAEMDMIGIATEVVPEQLNLPSVPVHTPEEEEDDKELKILMQLMTA
jgi:hypothetical protein